MADQDPVFQIQRVYLKEASLEQPNSPAILLEQEQPNVDIQLGVEATPVAEGVFEVCVTATVQTKIKDRTVFLVEASRPASSRSATCPKSRWARSWASPARRSSTRICAATWPT
jgi:protein-export chaperone SecB